MASFLPTLPNTRSTKGMGDIMGLPKTYHELVVWGAKIALKNPELSSDIYEILESARTEIEGGESLRQELDFAVQGIKDLVTDPDRGGTPQNWNKALVGKVNG